MLGPGGCNTLLGISLAAGATRGWNNPSFCREIVAGMETSAPVVGNLRAQLEIAKLTSNKPFGTLPLPNNANEAKMSTFNPLCVNLDARTPQAFTVTYPSPGNDNHVMIPNVSMQRPVRHVKLARRGSYRMDCTACCEVDWEDVCGGLLVWMALGYLLIGCPVSQLFFRWKYFQVPTGYSSSDSYDAYLDRLCLVRSTTGPSCTPWQAVSPDMIGSDYTLDPSKAITAYRLVIVSIVAGSVTFLAGTCALILFMLGTKRDSAVVLGLAAVLAAVLGTLVGFPCTVGAIVCYDNTISGSGFSKYESHTTNADGWKFAVAVSMGFGLGSVVAVFGAITAAVNSK